MNLNYSSYSFHSNINMPHRDEFDARMITPFTCIIGGSPMSGKTTFVHKLLENRNNLIDKEFDYLIWFYGQSTPFIEYLRNQRIGIPTEVVHSLPQNIKDSIQTGKKGHFVIDDLMQSVSESQAVTDLFCNKVQHTNVSVILLMQNLFYHGKERTTLLRCAHYMVVFRNPLDGSVPLYLAQKIMPLHKKLFMDIFDEATRKPFGYLYIDGKQTTPPSARFRGDIFKDGVQNVYIVPATK